MLSVFVLTVLMLSVITPSFIMLEIIMLSLIMPSFDKLFYFAMSCVTYLRINAIYTKCHKSVLYASHYVKCHYAECRYAECRCM